MLLAVFIAAIRAGFNETKIENIKYVNDEDKRLLSFDHAIAKNEGIQMRVSAERGSLVDFKNINTKDEWSFEFTFKNLHLNYPEFAGIYLWYTDQKIHSGDFNGVNNKFSGLMTGIEFLGRGLEIVLGSNDGKETPKHPDDIIILRDTVNPERFRDVNDFRIKVISTKKNFKVEIYDGERLLYDNLRFIEAPILGPREGNKYFSISTQYHKVPADKIFFIRDIQLYERIETEEYDPYLIRAEAPRDLPRYGTDIDHPSKEVQHMISAVEHMMAYLRSILGHPGGSTVLESAMDAKNAVISQQKQIREILGNTDHLLESLKQNGTRIIGSKIGDLELEVKSLQRSLYETQHLINEWGLKMSRMNNNIILVFVIVALISIAVLMLVRRKTESIVKKDS
ncbi:putative Concanavalin A-like lectin/glucanase protein [Trachipleistophora hominis]|uniref:Putative Concanavalin A-like lectin/glucanase protein n=1 Tax=Trachipleistophora hominis TaxID=72359 RepID=L7JRI2_TRAHO|nr:putative Concanavalin A-like lectin/glucanase protein [Trachipleistophora hominis]